MISIGSRLQLMFIAALIVWHSLTIIALAIASVSQIRFEFIFYGRLQSSQRTLIFRMEIVFYIIRYIRRHGSSFDRIFSVEKKK